MAALVIFRHPTQEHRMVHVSPDDAATLAFYRALGWREGLR